MLRRRLQTAAATLTLSATQQRAFFNPFNSNNNADKDGKNDNNKGPGQMPNFQEMMKMAQQMQQMQQQAMKGDGTMKDPPKLVNMSLKQLNEMRRMIEMQKNMVKNVPGMGAMAAKQAEFADGILASIDAELAKRNYKTPEGFNEKPKVEEVGENATASNTNASSSGSTPSNVMNINGVEVDLGPEVEALFQELKQMREKRNHFRGLADDRETENAKLRAELKQLKERNEKVTEKLKLAERDVMLLNSESLDLKESAKQAKILAKDKQSLQTKVASLSNQDVAPYVKQIEDLHTTNNTQEGHIKSLQRKLDRARKRSPLLQFSMVVSDLKRFHHASSTDPAAAKESSDEAFSSLQDSYEQRLWSEWETLGPQLGGAKVLSAACKEFLGSTLERAKLDAIVQLDNTLFPNVSAFKQDLEGLGFVVEKGGENGSFRVLGPQDESLNSHLGPYGVLRAYKETVQASATTAKDANKPAYVISNVTPFLSPSLAQNPARSSTTMDTSRSSGPGGQAVNVSETQITVKLYVDGELCIVSEAQDSRSALSNREAAFERLYGERLEHFNKITLRSHGGPKVITVDCRGGEDAAAVLPALWNDLCAPCEHVIENRLEKQVVSWVKQLVTAEK